MPLPPASHHVLTGQLISTVLDARGIHATVDTHGEIIVVPLQPEAVNRLQAGDDLVIEYLVHRAERIPPATTSKPEGTD